ncbi:hypothetical protein [Streptomyces sp. AC555_RSS877]|uniref:hypothetical protein n=1 Tax=Streptomyces sp. AC555_RSS877 TaxID=2823688 RepID=UPI001C264A0E|nr:hypothetical protein [Streptomyces sp. AC555_RSS877]
MRTKCPVPTRSAVTAGVTTAVAAAAVLGALAPSAAALPLPLPVAAVEPLVTEGVSVEGPLLNSVNLPSLK